MKQKPKHISLCETVSGLRYIADSPPRDYGGFNPKTVEIARSALLYLMAAIEQAAAWKAKAEERWTPERSKRTPSHP
jgi:hypothetical protein